MVTKEDGNVMVTNILYKTNSIVVSVCMCTVRACVIF